MTPDSVGAVGGATVPADTTSTPTTSTTSTTPAAKDKTAAFDDALKVARSTVSEPDQKGGTPSAQALARGKELGLADGAGAYDVLNHRYARVEGGSHDGRYVNTSGNGRSGQTFEIVERDGYKFHVYGDKIVRVDGEKPEVSS